MIEGGWGDQDEEDKKPNVMRVIDEQGQQGQGQGQWSDNDLSSSSKGAITMDAETKFSVVMIVIMTIISMRMATTIASTDALWR